MEIGENGEKAAGIITTVASVPVFSTSGAEGVQEGNEGNSRKISKNRRVSFAASSQFLEPINPFEVLGA
jgi:hypothetical protein